MSVNEVDGRTTVVSANWPEMTSNGIDIALAQCLVADSQSWESIDDCRSARED